MQNGRKCGDNLISGGGGDEFIRGKGEFLEDGGDGGGMHLRGGSEGDVEGEGGGGDVNGSEFIGGKVEFLGGGYGDVGRDGTFNGDVGGCKFVNSGRSRILGGGGDCWLVEVELEIVDMVTLWTKMLVEVNDAKGVHIGGDMFVGDGCEFLDGKGGGEGNVTRGEFLGCECDVIDGNVVRGEGNVTRGEFLGCECDVIGGNVVRGEFVSSKRNEFLGCEGDVIGGNVVRGEGDVTRGGRWSFRGGGGGGGGDEITTKDVGGGEFVNSGGGKLFRGGHRNAQLLQENSHLKDGNSRLTSK
ncbi:hypothetical protein PVK06_003217 [Gossypium arboreum]|uniref:Uncharacterized protein n=1 Tax=Gossypium arboreum TaxID=29729 RepID=A0ABR0R5Y0_GOSAR|nr:hypothetical protein PVK06_003217 [Gossypium arboreum]